MAVSLRAIGRVDGHTNFATQSFKVASGVTVAIGDAVGFDGSGRITNASIGGERLVGVCLEAATGNAGGTVEALVCVDPLMRYLVDNDNDSSTFAATMVGEYFNLTGASGAQLVDTSSNSTTLGQLLCLEYNPQIDPVSADTSWGVFLIANHAFYPYVANS